LGKTGTMTSAVNENAIAFLNQIDSIKSTDISPERLRAFASEEDFNGSQLNCLLRWVHMSVLPRTSSLEQRAAGIAIKRFLAIILCDSTN
jgi:hypothetical protein